MGAGITVDVGAAGAEAVAGCDAGAGSGVVTAAATTTVNSVSLMWTLSLRDTPEYPLAGTQWDELIRPEPQNARHFP